VKAVAAYARFSNTSSYSSYCSSAIQEVESMAQTFVLTHTFHFQKRLDGWYSSQEISTATRRRMIYGS